MNSDIEIQDRTPTLTEYLNITDEVGWSNYVGPETAAVALANSLFCVVAIRDSRWVGIARIVGDRAISFYVQDVAVLPDFQDHRAAGYKRAVVSDFDIAVQAENLAILADSSFPSLDPPSPNTRRGAF